MTCQKLLKSKIKYCFILFFLIISLFFSPLVESTPSLLGFANSVLKNSNSMSEQKKSAENILVTGGTGYIGSHTVLCLLEAGFIFYINFFLLFCGLT
jgi:predicted glycosyltransferase